MLTYFTTLGYHAGISFCQAIHVWLLPYATLLALHHHDDISNYCIDVIMTKAMARARARAVRTKAMARVMAKPMARARARAVRAKAVARVMARAVARVEKRQWLGKC